MTGHYALDLHPDDIYCCTADPGWVTGTSYGIIAPLVIGATMIVDEAEMEPERWLGILQDQQVTVWYTAPTAIRMLMKLASAERPGWPSMFRGYLNEPERYRKCFVDGWYLSGDLAQRDADGYFWFLGRADDMIKSAGHLIGPFEVESALMEHAAVAEAAAIGIPEPTAGEIVKSLVALKPGFTANEDLRKSLLAHARKRLGPAVAPREIDFRANLPKTRSGKIMRRLLRARELGLPEGDISTLEGDER